MTKKMITVVVTVEGPEADSVTPDVLCNLIMGELGEAASDISSYGVTEVEPVDTDGE